jgi:hypothetical protein
MLSAAERAVEKAAEQDEIEEAASAETNVMAVGEVAAHLASQLHAIASLAPHLTTSHAVHVLRRFSWSYADVMEALETTPTLLVDLFPPQPLPPPHPLPPPAASADAIAAAANAAASPTAADADAATPAAVAAMEGEALAVLVLMGAESFRRPETVGKPASFQEHSVVVDVSTRQLHPTRSG